MAHAGTTGMETASFQFLKWSKLYETEKPFQIFVKVPEGIREEDRRATNLEWQDKEVTVEDCRPNIKDYTLDEHGFMFCDWSTSLRCFEDFTNRELVTNSYLPQVESLVRNQVEDVDKIFIFDWRLRRHDPEPQLGRETLDLNDPTDYLNPVTYPHIDQAPSAVVNRVRKHLPNEADELLKRRVRVINVWRPIGYQVEDWPLALCDGATIAEKDLVETAHIRKSYHGSTLYVLHSEGQRWNFLSGQRPDEVTIFKNFDSKADVKAKWCPHASFLQSEAPADATPRQSIEVRALVFSRSCKQA